MLDNIDIKEKLKATFTSKLSTPSPEAEDSDDEELCLAAAT